MSRVRKAVGGAVATAVVVLACVAPASAGGAKIFDLFGQKLVKPETVFLTANSGPYLDELVWTDWGEERATATGVLISDCASCAPPERRAVTFVLSRLEKCKARGGKIYRRAQIQTTDENGNPDRGSYPTGYPVYCKKN